MEGITPEQKPTMRLKEDPALQQVNMPSKKLLPVERPHRSRLLAGAAAHGEAPTQQEVLLSGTAVHGGPMQAGAVLSCWTVAHGEGPH